MTTSVRPVRFLRQVCWTLALVLAQQGYAQDRVSPNCPFHLIIALDFSASERAFIDEIQTALYALTNRFELHPNSLKMGIVSFNRGADMILPLTGERVAMDHTIRHLYMPLRVYATDIHAGLALAGREFAEHGQAGVPRFLVLVSDGDPHAHSRGFGFREDLRQAEILKEGTDLDDAVHIFSLYTGEEHRYSDQESEWVRMQAIEHMRNLASDEQSYFSFKDYPDLINLIEQISSCL